MNATITNAVQSVDKTFLLIFGISAALLLILAGSMIWFVYRYNRKRHPVPADFDHNLWAEIIWIVLPTILVMGMFWSGWTSYRALRDAPPDALTVKVTARMWSWSFEYPNGRQSGDLVVPVGKAIKLQLTSKDVIHGFYAPAFRIKIDTVPGMTTYGWFRADEPGEHVIYCSVYCGLQHAKMLSTIKAVSQAEFDAFLAQGAGSKAAASGQGKALLESKGCLGCHSLDGTILVGPSFKDLAGRDVILVDANKKETKIKVDEDYLKKAILGPKTALVKGFDAVMPEYQGQLTPEELDAIIAFLLDREPAPAGDNGFNPEAGKAVAEAQGCLGCHSTDGSVLAGPSFKGLFGGKGLAGTVDRDYVIAVLANPAAKFGSAAIMPPFPDLPEKDRENLLLYLESLGQPGHEHHEGMDMSHGGMDMGNQTMPAGSEGHAGHEGHAEGKK